MWIVVVAVIVALLIWLAIQRFYSWILTAKDMTYIYEYLKRDYGPAFDGLEKILLTTAIIESRNRLKKGRLTVHDLEEAINGALEIMPPAERAISIRNKSPDQDDKHEIDMLETFIIYVECTIISLSHTKSSLTAIVDCIQGQRAAIRKAIEKAERSFADGKVPVVERNAVDTFMVSPSFHSVREHIGISDKLRFRAVLLKLAVQETFRGIPPDLLASYIEPTGSPGPRLPPLAEDRQQEEGLSFSATPAHNKH